MARKKLTGVDVEKFVKSRKFVTVSDVEKKFSVSYVTARTILMILSSNKKIFEIPISKRKDGSAVVRIFTGENNGRIRRN